MDSFDRLLEQSSLGTPGATQLRLSVPGRVVRRAFAAAEAERARQETVVVDRLFASIEAVEEVMAGNQGSTGVEPCPPVLSAAGLDDGVVGEQDLASAIDPAPTSLDALAAAASVGNRHALEEFLTRLRGVVYPYVRGRLWTYPGGANMVDDVAQEVCVAVVGAQMRGDAGSPVEAFVYRIAAAKIADVQSVTAAADPSTSSAPESANESAPADLHGGRQSVDQHAVELLNRLPDKLREILLLRVVAEMSAEETGRALNLTPQAVRVGQHRALVMLRGFVGRPRKGPGGSSSS